jgi:uncharacterized membrane protein
MPTLENFIKDYYIDPIWAHSGYNIVNTLTYAVIAIAAVYLLFRIMKGRINFDLKFLSSVMCFVLLGSTVRVVTDSIDTGVFKPITPIHQMVLDSHIYDYGYFTTTPGIYLVTASILLISIALLHKMKKMGNLWIVGLALWLPHFLLLVPFMKYAAYAIPILVLTAIPAYLAYLYFKKDLVMAGIVAGHALDGAATFFVIDIFSKISGIQYGEQHVFSSAIGTIGGTYLTFYLIKVAVSFCAAYVVTKEKMNDQEKTYIALVLMIMGFAPGIRDVLRMVCGA